MGTTEMFGEDVSADELASLVREAVRDLLARPPRRASAPPKRRSR